MFESDVANKLAQESTISLRNERPPCIAFPCVGAIRGPKKIDELFLTLENADYFSNRATLWMTLEMVSDNYPERLASLMSFDYEFAQIFLSGVARTMCSGIALNLVPRSGKLVHVEEYVTRHREPNNQDLAQYTALSEEYVPPHTFKIWHEGSCMVVGAQWKGESDPRPFFLLPKTDAFIKRFALMSYMTIAVMHEALDVMKPRGERLLLAKS